MGQPQDFVKVVEATTDAFVCSDNVAVEDARRTLLQVRKQYDVVHHEAEQKEARLKKLREEIRSADSLHNKRSDEMQGLQEVWQSLDGQLKDTVEQMRETLTNRKVYEHMLARIQKEQAILRQKMLKMEDHLSRKRQEVQRNAIESARLGVARTQEQRALEAVEQNTETERTACSAARQAMEAELEKRREANRRRADFESWRHEVAREAANEAFNASAGRLRKLLAVEKLASNCLQKITFEQVERSQTTEDGFQKIREVTGLTDVMDIVHKFLNRDVEHEQLKGSAKDAEVRLEALRQDFDAFKRETEGITFDHNGGSGEIYKAIEHSERSLVRAMEDHELCRTRLQRTNMQVEHMKRWATRVGQQLGSIEESPKVEVSGDLEPFFRKLELVIEKFVGHVSEQIADGKVTKATLEQDASSEMAEHSRIMTNQEFLRANVRVQLTAARTGLGRGTKDDDPETAFAEERERCKADSAEVARAAQAKQKAKEAKEQKMQKRS